MSDMVRKRIQIARVGGIFMWLWPLLLALLLGWWGSWIDFHTDEQTVILGAMFVFGAVVGAAAGLRRGLVCGIIMGASLPIDFIIKRKMGVTPSWGTAVTEWPTLVTIIPSIIGVLLGAGARKTLRARIT
jgi:hypothetical protein